MNKDAYYFPHFCNARHDRKLRRARKELGLEAYGIFFMLLEVLREQTDYAFPMDDIDLLAEEFGTSEQKIRTVISNYGLFEITENHSFFSSKLLMFIQPYLDRKKQARVAANARWHKELPEPMQEQSSSNASKVKKSKVNKEEYKDDFECFWNEYPAKSQGKGSKVKAHQLYIHQRKTYTHDDLMKSIKGYISTLKEEDWRKPMHVRTFLSKDAMNFADYMEYVKEEPVITKIQTGGKCLDCEKYFYRPLDNCDHCGSSNIRKLY